jgi:hypothetical protein
MLVLPKHSVLRPEGGVLVDGRQMADLLQCRHCQHTWIVRPGSGTRRGWCLRCGGPLCGKPACMTGCTPIDQQVEDAYRLIA